MDIDGPWVALVVGAPHPLQDHLAREDATRRPGQQLEQAGLLRPQVDPLPISQQLAAVEVQLDAIGHRQSTGRAEG